MRIIPAIDLKGGKCVRLYQGDYNQETVFSEDPLSVATKWQQAGITSLHLVDLDGAACGEPRNLDIIKTIVQTTRLPTQVGGGIRTEDTVVRLLSIGVQRVILGTLAIEDPELVKRLCHQFNQAIIVSIDAKEGLIATRGWKFNTTVNAIELARQMVEIGVPRILYTDIGRDGTLTAPNYQSIAELIDRVKIPIIAAGGISSKDHLQKLKQLRVEGVVVGRAFYTGDIDLKEALALERDSQ
jgi:phosphoribosylformimino-5-aminoimidazole carboxamide ribotide isomerase